MKSKRTIRAIAIAMAFTLSLGVQQVGLFANENSTIGKEMVAYAATGKQTPTGIISGKLTYEDKIPESATLEQLKAISTEVTVAKNPEYFGKNSITNSDVFDIGKIYITDKPVYAHIINASGGNSDVAVQVTKMVKGSTENTVIKTYSIFEIFDDIVLGKRTETLNCTDKAAYDYLVSEETPVTPPVTEPTEPEKKVYSTERLGGIDRYDTCMKIASKFGSTFDNVILTAGYDFPDALSGSVLSTKYNAPILLTSTTDNECNDRIINYIKEKVKSTGTIYILGGTSAVPESVVTSLKAQGYTNFVRLGGLNRFETNLKIVNNLNIAKGTPVVVANSENFADSLAISSVAAAKGMPIFLTNTTMEPEVFAKIKEIAPSKIYIAGGTAAVTPEVESALASVGSVTRLGGINRYETSLVIAKHFAMPSTTITVADGRDFPDALAGSALAAKNNSSILLVEDYAETLTPQKEYLDTTKITKVQSLGGTTAVADSILNTLTK